MTNPRVHSSTTFVRWATRVLLMASILGLLGCSSAPETTPAATLPEGWSVRADAGSGADNQLTVADGTYHFMMGGAPSNNGTFYNPAWTAPGDHSFSATFTQNQKATHPTSYGLMFGGSDLAGGAQMYSYFLVRQAGEYYIADRNGGDVKAVAPWTANPAIVPESADGKQTNTLMVQVAGNEVIFSVNGTEVKRVAASELHTTGLYGFRIGHGLDITVTNVMN